ncbi:MAG: signal peptidase I [Bacilli bacterium]|nr:signal peptidase I [Bacilli bacterium]
MNNYRVLKNFSILFSLIIYIFLYRLFVLRHFLKYAEFITATFLVILTFFSILFFDYRKNKTNPLKKQVTIITILQIIIFFSISYGLGLFVGFLKNSYSLTFGSILNNIFATIVVIISIELLRYILLNGNSTRKVSLFFITFVLIIFELSINIGISQINSIESLFKLLTTIILPITVKSSVMSYLTLNVGYRPALIYRLVMDLYVFIVPIVPNYGEYLTSMMGILFPFLIYLYSSRTINEYYNGVEYEIQKSAFRIIDIPIISFILILVALVSGAFSYYVIGIATLSMTPKINKGDAVLIHKIKNIKEVKVGDVVVFKFGNRSTVHRLVDIEKVNNKVYYRTKGDANNTNDNINLQAKDIKGKVILRIPAVAYPSIYLNEKMK